MAHKWKIKLLLLFVSIQLPQLHDAYIINIRV
jgi:hypothetical protein